MRHDPTKENIQHDPAKENLGNVPAKNDSEERKKGENKGIDFSDYDYADDTDAEGRQYWDWWLKALMFILGVIF